MAYCMAPFRNVYINNGKARPCCWYERRELTNKVDNLIEVVDVFNSNEFDAIRNNPSNKPSGCWKCQMHEDNGGVSHRMLWNKREKDDGDVKLTDLDIYMGNLCNLACVTCSSHNSSKWIAEEKQIFGSSFKDKQDDIDINLNWELVKDLKRIKLAGGEVTLMPHHETFLQQLIEFDVAKNITLVYIVNSTQDPRKFENLWSKFKNIEFIVSLDGVGELSDYIRYHSDWNTVSTNIIRATEMGIQISANSVVNILNVYHLPEILEWWKHKGSVLWRILDYPQPLSIVNLKPEHKDLVAERLKDYNELAHVIEHMYKEQGDWNSFVDWITPIDNNRKYNWQQFNPQYV